MARVEAAAAGVRERRVDRLRRLELRRELLRRPEVVVVEEADPAAARRLDPGVPRARDAARDVVADDDEPRVVDRGQPLGRLVGRPVVDDDDLVADTALLERGRQRGGREEVPAAPRRDHDRDVERVRHPGVRATRVRFIGKAAMSLRRLEPRQGEAEAVQPGEGRAEQRPRKPSGRAVAGALLQAEQEGAGEGRPRHRAAAVLEDAHVVPCGEQRPKLVLGVPRLEGVRPVVLVAEDERHDGCPAGAEHAGELRSGVRRVRHVLVRLDARHEVERVVRKRKELVRDDVGDAVRVARDVEPDAPRSGREEVVVRPRPAPDVEEVVDGMRERPEHLVEPGDELAEMEVVGLRRRRMAARAADGVERLGRGDHRAARHSELHCRPARRQGKWR